MARFFWDLVDEGTDGSQEDDDLEIEDLADAIATMGYFNGDGDCNEPNVSVCSPLASNATPGDPGYPLNPTSHTNTRDSYNAWDFGDLLANSQADVRDVNCVDNALD